MAAVPGGGLKGQLVAVLAASMPPSSSRAEQVSYSCCSHTAEDPACVPPPSQWMPQTLEQLVLLLRTASLHTPQLVACKTWPCAFTSGSHDIPGL